MVLTTLDTVSDVHVLSAPSVTVRNNVEADFNSGQQIPVASTILNNNGNTNTDNTKYFKFKFKFKSFKSFKFKFKFKCFKFSFHKVPSFHFVGR